MFRDPIVGLEITMRFRIIAILTATLPAALSAQQLDSTRLAELVVTATRTPIPLRRLGSSADLFRAEELQRRQLSSLASALQLAPGGTIVPGGAPGAVTSLFLRGVASTQTLILVDGIRVNDANTSAASFLGGADLSGTGRVEIVRGPQSTLHGGAAIGGVVSLDAERGRGPFRGWAELGGGSFESWRGRVTASGGGERFGLAAAFTANGTENQRRPNDWEQRTQVLRGDARLGRGVEGGFTFRGLQNEYTSPGDLRTTNTTPEGTTTFENNLATIWVEARPVARWRSRLLAGGQEQFSRGTGRFDGGDEFSFSLSNSRRVLDWQNTLELGPRATLVAGLNREWSTASSDHAPLDERLFAAWADAEFLPTPELAITAGIRSDNYNTFDDAVTWRVTGAYVFTRSDTKLRASYGTSFMPPSLAARFGGAFQNPNPGIRPERSRGWDAGVEQRFRRGDIAFSATWFRNSLRDLIAFESAPFPALGQEVNVDRARTSGLEVGGRVQAGRIDARLGWTYLRAVSLSEPDPELARLIRRPRHTLSGDVLVSAGRETLAGAGIVAVTGREDSDFNAFPAARVDPGNYAIVRLYGSRRLRGGIELRARIDNLFDAGYEPVYGFPGLGRNLSGSVAVRF